MDKLINRAIAASRYPEPGEGRALRRSAGISQAELAAEIGVDQSSLMRWEAGLYRPRGENLTRYVAALDKLRALEVA